MKAKNDSEWKWKVLGIMFLTICTLSLGCSATPIGLAMHMAGDAIDDVDEAQKSEKLVGASVSQADADLGAPVEVLVDTRTTRQWRVYNAPMDPLNTSRYVLEVDGTRILAVEKVQEYSDPVEYEGALALLRPKVMGNPPEECEANLGMGRSLLTVRSQTTGETVRLYDARVVKELQGPHYCVLRFGASNTCEKINLVKAETSTGEGLDGT